MTVDLDGDPGRPAPGPDREGHGPGRDDRELEEWLGRLAPRLLAHAARRVRPSQDAADVVAQVLLTAWRRRDDLPVDEDQAAAWVFGVARHTMANHRRGRVRQQALADRLRQDLAVRATPAAPAGPGSRGGDRGELVRDALAALPDDDREILCLVAWDGFGVAEAGHVLGLTPSGSRSRWARAKRRLAAALAAPG